MASKPIIKKERVNGSTTHSVNFINRHLKAIGEVHKITAYMVVSSTGAFGNVRITFSGKNKNSLTVGGLAWGYTGEGVRAFKTVLDNLEWTDSEKIFCSSWLGEWVLTTNKLPALSRKKLWEWEKGKLPKTYGVNHVCKKEENRSEHKTGPKTKRL